MTPEERAIKLVQQDQADHCSMTIGGYKLKFGNPATMTTALAASIIKRIRRSIETEIQLAIDEAGGTAVEAAVPAVEEAAAPKATTAAATVPTASTGAPNATEVAQGLAGQLGLDVDAVPLIALVLNGMYKQGAEAMRDQMKLVIANLFPTLSGDNRIALSEVRTAGAERLAQLELGQEVTRAAA